MRRWMLGALTAVLALTLAAPASAASAAAVTPGGCPSGFELHPAMPDHTGAMDGHIHAGAPNPDRNGDGLICMKVMVTPVQEVHIHIDNIR